MLEIWKVYEIITEKSGVTVKNTAEEVLRQITVNFSGHRVRSQKHINLLKSVEHHSEEVFLRDTLTSMNPYLLITLCHEERNNADANPVWSQSGEKEISYTDYLAYLWCYQLLFRIEPIIIIAFC